MLTHEAVPLLKRFLVLGVLVAALVIVSVKPASAQPCQQFTRDFYTDDTYTVICGERYVTCNAEQNQGCVTAYYITNYEGCCGWTCPGCP